jgi:molybdopterin synthase sulfur carrier subunit
METENSTLTLLAFGQLTDITGQSTWQMESVTDTDHLKTILVEKYPALAQSKYLVAVNMEVVRGNVELKSGDVVALLPPFSGG